MIVRERNGSRPGLVYAPGIAGPVPSQRKRFPQDPAVNLRVQGRLRDHIYFSAEDFLESRLQTAREKGRPVGAAIN